MTNKQKNRRTEEQKNKNTKVLKNKPIKFISFYVSQFLSFYVFMFLSFYVFMFFSPPSALAIDFDPGNLISDGAFINTNSINTTSIQRFLESKGSYLKDFTENGRSAAQIIYDAAHGYGDASGDMSGINIDYITGTVNPQVLLVTLQKEQSLITKTTRDDNALDKAMGYACPDSGGCSPDYAGFTKQVENAAWQLKYNYERAQGHGFSDYQVGQTMNFSNTDRANMDVTFANRATASLYRYTPHTYNGNYNFWNLYFNTYKFQDPEYGNSWVSQNTYPEIYAGEGYNFILAVKNTGSATWTREGVFLGTSSPLDRESRFIRADLNNLYGHPSHWLTANRVFMNEDSVAPGSTATFSFWMSAPPNISPGTYREYFRLVAEGITWMEDYGIYWDVKVLPESAKYHYEYIGQNAYPSITPSEGYNFILAVKNTGSATWTRDKVFLGTSSPLDRESRFIRADLNNLYGHPSHWSSANRIFMNEDSVAPGSTATFSFWMSAPPNISPGTYREYFRLVAEGITWMEDYGIYWDVKVDYPHATWSNQSAYPMLHAGEKTAVWIDFLNSGSTTWSKTGAHPINLGTSNPLDRVSNFYYSDWTTSNRISLDQNSVVPGQVGKFTFFISIPQGTPPGVYNEYFRPVAEGLRWLEDQGVFIRVTVI